MGCNYESSVGTNRIGLAVDFRKGNGPTTFTPSAGPCHSSTLHREERRANVVMPRSLFKYNDTFD